MAANLPPLVPFLTNIKRWIWLLIFGGCAAFIALVALLDEASPPGTPANELVTWANGWLFLLPAGMIAYGVYVSARWWRCPGCGLALPTKYPVPMRCLRCATALRLPPP